MKILTVFILMVITSLIIVSFNANVVRATAIDNGIGSRECNAIGAGSENYYCQRGCNCSENIHVNCGGANLSAVPQELPQKAIIIDLSYNHISDLHPDDFSKSGNVRELILNNNKLAKVAKDVFAGLACLERLRLANNTLTSLAPDTFGLASNLYLLDLSGNSIMLPKSGPFLIQPNLRELYCNNCNLTQLYNDTFDNLRNLTTLELAQNNFDTNMGTQVFLPLQNLITLKLDTFDPNQIQDLCFVMKSIETIHFHYINFSCVKFIAGKTFNKSGIDSEILLGSKKPNNEMETDEKAGGSVLIYMILAFTILCIIATFFYRKDIGAKCCRKTEPADDLA